MKKIGVLVLGILIISLATAANIGVSPSQANFEGVLRGGYAERPVIVTIDSEEEIDAYATKRGDIADWISFSEENFTVSKGNPYQITISVSPPTDTPNGNYTGFVTIRSDHLKEGSEGAATGLIMPALDIYVVVEVTDEEVKACKATNYKVSSVEEGDDIVFSIDILNEGNVRFSPKITLDFWDQESVNLVKQEEFSSTSVTPTKTETVTIKVPSGDLELGQYWVDVAAVDCYSESTLTFDVLEEGALLAFGTLEKITATAWAEIGDIVSIAALFRNDGEKPLEAKFKGEITYNGKTVQLLESDVSTLVPLDSKESFLFYFTPQSAGKYIVTGRIYYDNKRSYDQSAVINVKPEPFTSKTVLKIAAYAILIVLIVILLHKIRQERKRLLSGSRRFK